MRAFLSILGMYNYDPTVFADFSVPDGVDRDTAINKILFDNAELGLVYTDPDIFGQLVKNWTNINLPNWNRAFEALMSGYNPIYNYDKNEEWKDISNSHGKGTTERDVAGFNDNTTLVKDNKISSSDENHAGLDHKGRIYGNIGVKTTQSMIEEEMNLRVKFNIYQMISDSFKSYFCIKVY